jgi:predicted dehydrogenase
MMKIAIIGGGRWAKTIAGVLARIPTASDNIVMYSRHHAASAAHWIKENGLEPQIRVISDWPNYLSNKPDAVIVANRVADHVAAAGAALEADVPVMVEKPIAIGAATVRLLCAHTGRGSMLAASHVFLFTQYIEAFAAVIAEHGHARSLELLWEDGEGDIVRGEVKTYDPSVTVFDDVLPHAVPILAHIAKQPLSMTAVDVSAGGAQVAIEAHAGALPVRICLTRNAKSRKRILAARLASGRTCTLDFTVEPGFICLPGHVNQNADPLWHCGLRPLGTMLMTFLKGVRGEQMLDPRLSAEIALASAVFADAVREPYRAQQRQWLAGRQGPASNYALRENQASAE